MSAFYIWMSQQDHLCMRLMEERWKTADLGEAFNAGMERAAEIVAPKGTHSRHLKDAAKAIRKEISND